MIALLTLGCAPTELDRPQDRPPLTEDTDTDTPDTTAPDTDTAPDTGVPEPEVTEEEIGDQVLEDDWIFALDVIHEIEITLPEASVSTLDADPYTYAEGSISFDGEEIPLVGVRLRGKIGSFRTLSGKPKFKIDFNQYITDQRFYGLETISLNNSVVDCSYIKEHIGYALFEAAGVPASRTGLAQVSVNGAPYGLYTIIEVPDDRFLRRHYDDSSGNLYDGKYVWYGGYSYTLLDFAEGHDDLFQLEEGTDVGHADITGVSTVLAASAGTPGYYAATSEVVDWPLLHRMWAVEQYVGQNDGYGLNTNNYRVYFDPADGRADLFPWDLDYSFLNDSDWGLSWSSPSGRLLYYCIFDATCAAAQRAVVSEVLTVAAERDLVGLLDELTPFIDDAARSDPRRECSESSIASAQAGVRAWLVAKDASMRSFWGL
jgi:hypothetical protein